MNHHSAILGNIDRLPEGGEICSNFQHRLQFGEFFMVSGIIRFLHKSLGLKKFALSQLPMPFVTLMNLSFRTQH